MMSFVDLFREGQDADRLDNGRFARSKAEGILSGTGITFKRDCSPVSIENGSIVGIAFYSLPELDLLDQLVLARPKKANSDAESIIVFDVLSCKTMEDVGAIMPDFGPFFQTPVVAIWRNGKLIDRGVGGWGRTLLAKRYNLNLSAK